MSKVQDVYFIKALFSIVGGLIIILNGILFWLLKGIKNKTDKVDVLEERVNNIKENCKYHDSSTG